MSNFTIPKEVADEITKAVLIDWRDYLQSELDQWEANKGFYLHPDDVNDNKVYIDACNKLIHAFGGE